MAIPLVSQQSFITGEVDEPVWDRDDTDHYMTSAQKLTNFQIGTTGLIKKRPGTEKVLDITNYIIEESRSFKFVDKNNNYYYIIAGDEEFHIFSIDSNDESVTFLQTLSSTPYTADDIQNLDYTNFNDNLIFTINSVIPSRIYISNYATPTFTFEALDIYPKPAYDYGNINYNNFTVSLAGSTSTVLSFHFTGLGSDPGFDSTWIGGQIIGGGPSVDSPLGYAIITNVAYAAGTTTITADIRLPFELTSYATKGSQYSVRQPVWTDAIGYPAHIFTYQNRVWYANSPTLNTTIFGSKINSPINLDVGIGADTDAIIYNINIENTGNIRWINGGKQLEIYCDNAELACPQNEDSALTPSTFVVKNQTSIGSHQSFKPFNFNNDSFFAALTGKAIYKYMFQGVGLAYRANNVTPHAQHLYNNPKYRAVIKGTSTSQDQFVYILNSDGSLVSFQFTGQSMLSASSPIEIDGDVTIKDIIEINNKLYLVKFYTTTNKYILERFSDDYKVDSFETVAMDGDGIITGLDRFNGYTIQVLYNNQDLGRYLVSGGTITVVYEHEGSLDVIVGLNYSLLFRSMYLYAGASASPFFKNVSNFYIHYYQSLDFYINNQYVTYTTFTEIQNNIGPEPKSGVAIVSGTNGSNRYETLTITQTSPFDLQITDISYQISASSI